MSIENLEEHRDRVRVLRVGERSKQRQRVVHRLSQMRKADEDSLNSRVSEETDPFLGSYNKNGLLLAPYTFVNLYKIFEKSDALQVDVGAMVQNVHGFGYQFPFLGDDHTQKDTPEAQRQLQIVQDFFKMPNDDESMIKLSKRQRFDYEVLGNSALEAVRNVAGEVAMLNYLPTRSCRLSVLDSEPTEVTVRLPRGGRIVEVKRKKYFRRIAQTVRINNRNKLIWFKEFGDPRTLNFKTGEYSQTTKYPATEVLWFKQHFAGYPYGIPRYIGGVLEILGRTSAQYVNYDLFRNQGIPPMLIMVSNGLLTDESLQELEDTINSWRGEEAFNRAALLEVTPEAMGLDDKGNAKIDIKFLHEYRKDDAMFQAYLKMTEFSIRKLFRLPPLYTGGTEEFNRACHSEDTQTLTENGWKYFWEVADEERIAVVDPQTHTMSFEVPEDLLVYQVEGERMIRLRNSKLDVLVTPNHGMHVKQYHGQDRGFSRWDAESMMADTDRAYLLPVAPDAFVSDPVDISISRDLEIEPELLLEALAYIIADGNVHNTRVRFGLKKERKIRLIVPCLTQLCKRLGISLGIRDTRQENGYLHVWFNHPEFSEWYRKECGEKAVYKRFPDWVYVLPRDLAQVVLDALIATDGNQHSIRAYRYTTVSKDLADQVHALSLLAGYHSQVQEWEDPRGNRLTCYNVYFGPRRETVIRSEDIREQTYSGRVYCFHVKDRLFVTRRNGKAVMSYNTAIASINAAEQQVFIPERSEFDEVINAKIIREGLGVDLWEYKSSGPQITGSDEITKGVRAFADAGAMTVNYAIELANRAYGLEISKVPHAWADLPIIIVKMMLNHGVVLKGMEDSLEAGSLIDVFQTIPETQGQARVEAEKRGPHQTKLPIFKSDSPELFSADEKSLYWKLLTIDDALKKSLLDHEITDADYEL